MQGIEIGTVLAIIAALGALATAGAGLIVALATRRKTDAETNKATTEAVVMLIKPLSERVAALEGEVAVLRKRIADFRRGVRLLCGQVTDAGLVPIWQPDEDDDDR